MQPSCYLLEPTAGATAIYLGEVSTHECLKTMPPADLVHVTEVRAAGQDGTWIDRFDLPASATVAVTIDYLEKAQLELIDFAATIGGVAFSTHDDAEAQLRFPSEDEALEFLRRALAPGLADVVIGKLRENPGCYVTNRDGSWQVFETFDAYLAGV